MKTSIKTFAGIAALTLALGAGCWTVLAAPALPTGTSPGYPNQNGATTNLPPGATSGLLPGMTTNPPMRQDPNEFNGSH
jgi:hypothetical protein